MCKGGDFLEMVNAHMDMDTYVYALCLYGPHVFLHTYTEKLNHFSWMECKYL